MFAAADPGFYLALDAGREDCMDVVDGAFYLPPTTVHTIADIVAYSGNNELKVRAAQALLYRATYPALCPPVPSQRDGCDGALAGLIIERGILPDTPANRIRAQLLAECACIGVSDLLTLDPVMLRINQEALNEVVSGQDLDTFRLSTVS